MTIALLQGLVAIGLGAVLGRAAFTRLQVWRAAGQRWAGSPMLVRWASRLVRRYDFDDHQFFTADDPPPSVVRTRRAAFTELADRLTRSAPESIRLSTAL